MSSDTLRHTRKNLRRIQAHITQSHLNQGVQQEPLGLVDVFYHPHNTLQDFNHLAPRRNTAWVPGDQIQIGIARLRELNRVPRLHFLEGLFPPVFARSLHKLGLSLERETELMIFEVDAAKPSQMPKLPPALSLGIPKDTESEAIWWEVWRSPRYEVVTNLVEPLFLAQDIRELTRGHQQDLILYRFDSPLAILRLTFHEGSVNLSAMAIRKVARTDANLKLLYQLALAQAVQQNATLVFTSPETGQVRQAARGVGFVDCGALVYYAEQNNTNDEQEELSLEDVAESILLLR